METPKIKQSQAPEMKWIGPIREINIQTDGTNLRVDKNETSGVLEFAAILTTILQRITK